MPAKVAWVEVLGRDTDALRRFYGELFEWSFERLEGVDYAIVPREENGTGGGVGAAPDGSPGHQTFYVGVDDVQAALDRAESLGGSKIMGPMEIPGGGTIGLFADPEGHTIGVVAGDAGQG